MFCVVTDRRDFGALTMPANEHKVWRDAQRE